MPIIIDTNCIANVFSPKAMRHEEFKPVLDWIRAGKGIMVTGGTKYQEELKKIPKYLRIINLLKDTSKLIVGNRAEIDEYQAYVESIKEDDDFDDEHLPAIVVKTKCRIICSEDTRSIPHVTDRKYYPKGMTPPVYYTSKRNLDLLCDEYVDSELKPLCKMKKSEANRLLSLLGGN